MKTPIFRLFLSVILFYLPLEAYAQTYCGAEPGGPCDPNDPNHCGGSIWGYIDFEPNPYHYCQNDTFTITLETINAHPVSIEWFIDGNNGSATYIGDTDNQLVVQAYVATTEPVVWCVKVYDISGCFFCAGAGGPPYPTPQIDALITPVCSGGTGAVDITVLPNGPPHTYDWAFLWSNGATTEDISGVPAGTYSVTVTSLTLFCDEIFTFEVPADGLTLSADIAPNTSCSPPDGAIGLTVGNPGTFTYQWSDGSTTEDLTGVAPGSYTVTVTSTAGCTETATYEVPDSTVPIGGLDITTGEAFCGLPTGSADLGVEGGAAPFTYQWSNGSTGEDLAAVAPGTYTVTVTAANGCTATATATVADSPGGPSLNADITPSTSCAPANGAIDLDVSPPAPAGQAYSFAWPGGATTEDLSGLAAGTYTVTVTIGSCTAEGSYVVADETAPPAPVATAIPATCGNANGGVELYPGGGTAPYAFAWSNGASTQNLAGLTPGTYSVTVMDALGCTGTASAVVEALGNSFSLSATAIADTGCGSPNGSLDLTVSPAGTYTYLWTGGATVEDPSGLAAGAYTVTATQAASGCTATGTFTVPGGAPEPDTTYVSGTSCDPAQTGVFEETLTDQDGCDSVVISDISLSPSDTTNVFGADCDPAMAGVFEEIFTNQYGCDSVVISTISLSPSDTTNLSGTDCDPSQVGVFEEILSNQYGCDSVVVTNISLAPSDTVLVFGTSCDMANTGIFEEVLTNQYGCDSVVVTTVTYSQADTTSISGATCDPAMAGVFVETLTGQGGCDSVVIETISLSPSDTTNIFGTDCDPANTGIFEQVLANQYGCDSVVVTTVTYSQADTTEVFQATCDPAMAGVFVETLTGQGGCDSLVIETISLSPSDTVLVFGTDCDPSQTGVFEEILNNQFGCDSVVVTTVTYSQADTVYVSGSTCDPALAGVFVETLTGQGGCDSVVIEAISLSPSDTTNIFGTDCDPGQTGVFEETFTNQFGCDSVVVTTVTLLPGGETALFSTTCDPMQAGVFTQTFTNQNGCDSTVTTTVTLLASDTAFLSTTTCDPMQAGVFTQIFTNQNGCDSTVTTTVTLLPGGETALFSTTCDPALAGIFTETLANQFGCDSTVTTTVAWAPPPVMSLAVSDFNGWGISCAGGADGSIAVSAAGVAPFTFSWPDGSALPQITGLPAGSYPVTVTDANGCTATAGATLDGPPPLQISIAVNDLDCFGANAGAISVQADGGAPPVRFSLDGVDFQASNVFDGLPAGAYQITALDANGCEAAELIFINAPVPVGVDLGEDLSIELGEGAVLQALVNVPYDSLAGIAWTGLGPSAECPACPEQTVFPFVTTAYSVTVTDANGCTGGDDLTVFVDRKGGIYVPNAFSPNGDGINDVLYVFARPGLVASVRSFLVFDRWGGLAFRGHGLRPNDPAGGWDGSMRGEPLGPGVFAWWAEVEFVDGTTEVLEGGVTLVR